MSIFGYLVSDGKMYSLQSTLQCGVRQGGVLSPVLFAVYVNSLIEMLRQSGYGCYVDSLFVGCVA